MKEEGGMVERPAPTARAEREIPTSYEDLGFKAEVTAGEGGTFILREVVDPGVRTWADLLAETDERTFSHI